MAGIILEPERMTSSVRGITRRRDAVSLYMATDQRYWERAKEAREKAEAAGDETTRRTWLEIAKGFERLAEQPSRDPVWRVERVKPKKKPR